MLEFLVHEIASRQLQQVVAIPWAQPAPVVAVPYPSFLEPKHIRATALQRKLLTVELNFYPAPHVESGYYPGSILAESNRYSFDVTNQTLPELNSYPVADSGAASGYYPGSTIALSNTSNFDIKRQILPDNVSYPSKADRSGHFPGSLLAESNRISFKIDRQNLPELNKYPPAVVPEQPFTSFMAPQYFIRQETRSTLTLPELNEYPQPVTSVAVLPAVYNLDILFRRDTHRILNVAIPVPGLAPAADIIPGSAFGMVVKARTTTMTVTSKTTDMTVRAKSTIMVIK